MVLAIMVVVEMGPSGNGINKQVKDRTSQISPGKASCLRANATPEGRLLSLNNLVSNRRLNDKTCKVLATVLGT